MRRPSNRAPAARALPLVVFLAAIVSIAACDPSASTGSPSPGAPSPPSATPSEAATGSPAPARTAIPGYEDWSAINPQAARITLDGEALVMELIGPRLWFHAERGVLFFTEVTGDFVATATVRTTRTSDPAMPPGRDGTIQLAGLMARAEIPVENYVFIVTGSIGAGNGVETKTTTDSRSIWVQRGVGDQGSADLRLCRKGEVFRLSWRPPNSDDDWQAISTFERPDLPETLQVGPNIYTDAVPDITARFEGLAIEPLPEDEAC